MKKLTSALILILTLTFAAPALAAPDNGPLDLVAMQEAGMSTESLGRFLAQSLGAQRAAPQLDADLLTRLARYGGDSLVVAWLDLDRAVCHQARPSFSQEMLQQLLDGGTPPADIRKLLDDETVRAARSRPEPAAAASVSVSRLSPATAPPAPAYQPPQVSAPSIAPPQAPEAPRRSFQELRPGQAADPASRLPLPYSTYDVRYGRQDGETRLRQRNDGGPWMGVMERELPDAHLAEVNSLGQVGQVGQEVFSRPSGHKVYRYYSGRPDSPDSGPDLRQEQKNREDLQIIFNDRARY
ncbi:MAG: hypothetical protein LBP33_02430 [Candidatus Adiutrix sp.]|jgi:hypothetical protein|nr:hypothetical protein [Candidatus Adiutrix sp.]